MGALAGNAAAREHALTCEPIRREYWGENQWHLAGASGCDVIPVALYLIKARANFEARQDGLYSDRTIRTASRIQRDFITSRIALKSNKKKRKKGREGVPALISNQLRVKSGSNPWSSVNSWAYSCTDFRHRNGVVQCNNKNGLLEWLLIVIYSIFRQRERILISYPKASSVSMNSVLRSDISSILWNVIILKHCTLTNRHNVITNYTVHSHI